MRKQEYMKLAKSVCMIMKGHDATQDEYGAYYINTPCGELRVSVEPFKPRKEYFWLFTRIQYPDRVCREVSNDLSFNDFNGKYNNVGNTPDSLIDWLEWYIGKLFQS